jgi:hypothetical protein
MDGGDVFPSGNVERPPRNEPNARPWLKPGRRQSMASRLERTPRAPRTAWVAGRTIQSLRRGAIDGSNVL